MLPTLKFIIRHPLNRRRPAAALVRFVAWQLGSRLKTEHVHSWVGETKLVVRNGMTGATGNIYCGLHEFADMAFVLHALKSNDLFLDVGANIGSYTVLASGVCGARTIAFEPDPQTAKHLRRNVAVNALDNLVEIHEVALGSTEGQTAFTVGRDTVNHVAEVAEAVTRIVPMRRLDDIPGAAESILIKMDVEDYEAKVLEGARKVLSSTSLIAIESEAQDKAVLRILPLVRSMGSHITSAAKPVDGIQRNVRARRAGGYQSCAGGTISTYSGPTPLRRSCAASRRLRD